MDTALTIKIILIAGFYARERDALIYNLTGTFSLQVDYKGREGVGRTQEAAVSRGRF